MGHKIKIKMFTQIQWNLILGWTPDIHVFFNIKHVTLIKNAQYKKIYPVLVLILWIFFWGGTEGHKRASTEMVFFDNGTDTGYINLDTFENNVHTSV